MRKLLLLFGCLCFLSLSAYAAGSPYTSIVAGGNWNDGATWGNASPGVAGTDFPNAGQTATISGPVIIPAGFAATVATLTITNNAASSLTIASTGSLTFTGVLATGTLTHGQVLVNGLLSVEEGATITGTQLLINATGTYRHNYQSTAGTIATATWAIGSTLEFKGYNAIAFPGNLSVGGLTQTFRNVTWDCASQSTDIALVGNSNFATVTGNFSVVNTNGSILGLSHSVNRTLTWNGNLTLAAGVIFDLNSDVVNNKNTTINLKGDLSIGSDDAIAIQSSGVGTVNFNGTGSPVQHFTNSSSLSTSVNFSITSPAIVDIADGNFIPGPGGFTLTSGSTLRVGSVDGLVIGTGSGNVQSTGTRTYTAGANIIYNGNATQNLGDEWSSPSGALSGVAVNLEIATTAGATVNDNIVGSTSVVGNLTLTSGTFNIGNSNTLVIQSNFNGNGGSLGGDATSGLTFSGSGSISGTINFASGLQNLKNFTIARSGNFVLGTPLTISSTGVLSFTSTGNLQFTGQTLTINGNITQSSTGGLSAPVPFASTNLIIGGTGALSSLPFCTSCGSMELNNLTLGRTSAGTYTLSDALKVNGILDLNSGTFTNSSALTMVAGSTFSRSSGTTMSGSSPSASGGAYNVNYSGNLTTGSELPSNSTDLGNVTSAGNVTLNSSITMNGNFTNNSGTFSAGAFNVTLAGANFTVNSGAFTINAGSTVTFSRVGSTTMGGAGIGGTQFGNLSINSGSTLIAPNANINVSGTWDNQGIFTASTGSVTFNGASQSVDPNGQAFNDVIFAGTGSKTLQGTLTTSGTLAISTGSTLDVGSNELINVAGSWTNNGTFVASGGTVNFNGASQIINSNGQPFFNLTLAGSGTKTLSAVIDINGNLLISGVTLNTGLSSNQINIAGNWTNNGTFTKRSGTVVFDGTTIISGSSTTSFNNVTITGAVTAPVGILDVSGAWLQSSGTFTHNGGTLQLSGANQSITPGGQTFNNLTVLTANTKTLQGAAIINGTLTLTLGTFDTNGFGLNLKGNFVSNSGSTLTASTVTFSGATIITGSSAPTFGTISISGSSSLTPNTSFNVNGNLANAGTLNAGSGTVTFGGTTAISGASTSSFNNVIISGTLTAPSASMNVGGSWTNNGTFNANSGTIVFNNATTVAGSSTTSFNSIQITGSLTAPATNMNVAGNFTNSGTFANGGGKVVFNGASQSISGSSTTFNNIDANSTSLGLGINTTVRLDGILTLGASGVFDADGAGSGVFIVSSSSQTSGGMIAALTTPANFSGNVSVERFIHSQTGGDYRFLSIPITNGNLGLWKSSIGVTGNFSDPSTGPNIGNNTLASVFTWDPTTQAYVAVSGGGGTVASVAVSNTTGYAAYDFNDGAATATYSGPIGKGSVPVTISNVNNNFNLVPNPYPSPIDWDNVTKTNVQDAMWLRTGNNVFSSYVAGVATLPPQGGWTGEIGTGQSFWTKSDGNGTSFTLTENSKTVGSSIFVRVAAPENYIRVKLISSSQMDETVIRFADGASDGNDSKFDASKKRNGNYVSALGQNNYMNISSYNTPTSATVDFAINSIGKILDGTSRSVYLRVFDVTVGNYSIKFTDLSTMSLGYRITLVDHFLNKETVVTDNLVYNFAVTQSPASSGDSRFELRIQGVDIVTAVADLTAGDTRVYPNPVVNKLHVKLSEQDETNLRSIVLIDVLGNVIVNSDKNKQLLEPGVKTIEMGEYASGFYILNVQSGDIVKSIRVIKK